MTAPADVWAIEMSDGSLLTSPTGTAMLWNTCEGVMRSVLLPGGAKPVRFRLVRADEPEQPAEPPRDDVGELRECTEALTCLVASMVTDQRQIERAQSICDRLAALRKGKEANDGN